MSANHYNIDCGLTSEYFENFWRCSSKEYDNCYIRHKCCWKRCILRPTREQRLRWFYSSL